MKGIITQSGGPSKYINVRHMATIKKTTGGIKRSIWMLRLLCFTWSGKTQNLYKLLGDC